MTWQPGQSGNPAGRMFETTLKRAITQCDGKKLRAAADKLLDAAANGEPWAIQMLADRLDGKPKQQLDVKADNTLTVVLAQTLEDGSIATLPAQGLTIDQAPEPVQHNDLQAISSVDTLHQEE